MSMGFRSVINHCKKFFRGMFAKILTTQIILLFIPILVIGSLSFTVSQRIISQQLTRINTAVLNQISDNIDSLVGDVYQLVTLYMMDSEIQKALQMGYIEGYERIIESSAIEGKITTYSLSFDQLRTHTMLLGINDIIFTSKHDSSSVTLEDIKRRSWYKQLESSKNHMLWSGENLGLFETQSEPFTVTLVKTLENQSTSSIYGLSVFSMEESIFYDIYKNIPNDGSRIYLIDSSGRILSDSQRGSVGQVLPNNELDSLLSPIANGTSKGSIGKDGQVTMIQKIKKLDWYVVYTIPVLTNAKIINSLKEEILLIALVSLLISVILSFFTARYFSRPLLLLTKKISRHLTSIPEKEKKSTGINEVDLLNAEYEILIERLENSIQLLVTEQEEKRKAEFHALQMQINPHFLYNTINSIKCLLWTGQTDLIEPTLNALIKLFRQTISRKDEIITLEDELESLRNYVFIQQIRTSNSIDLLLHVPEELKKCKVPKLLLQPIVENAIFHGLEPKNSKGRITIFCSSLQGVLLLEVEDNGVGMDEVTVSKLLDDKPSDGEQISRHIGIKNVHERIRLMCGPDYGITVQSQPGTGTQILLRLPVILEKEENNV